jgi:hypothetical protein
METNKKINVNVTAWLFLLSVLFAVLISGNVQAQRPTFVPQNLYVSIETTTASRTFQINSDLENFKGVKARQQGKTYGVTVGNKLITGKVRVGNFTTESRESTPIQSNTLELGSNFHPLQFVNSKVRLIEPYVTVSFETTKIKSNGTFTPPAPAKKITSTSTCGCQCPSSSGTQPDPDVPSPTNSPVSYSGNFGSTRLITGVGLKVHIQKGNLFLNLFGEMSYGLTLGTTASTQALLNTYVLSQTSVNFGAAIGLIRNKSNRSLRKIRFR